jgi:hypothetical protein
MRFLHKFVFLNFEGLIYRIYFARGKEELQITFLPTRSRSLQVSAMQNLLELLSKRKQIGGPPY